MLKFSSGTIILVAGDANARVSDKLSFANPDEVGTLLTRHADLISQVTKVNVVFQKINREI
jgi:hypothetical protein